MSTEPEETIFEPEGKLVLRWQNLFVLAKNHEASILTRIITNVRRKKFDSKWKEIISGISGEARNGRMIAVMGVTGAGKTTFLSTLAGWSSNKLKKKGEITLNDKNVDMREITSFVHEADIFHSFLTVKEFLSFTAKCYMGTKVSKESRDARVDKIIEDFGLEKCCKSLIGSTGNKKSISGGEMKRLHIATEVLRNPKVIIADEPTSGLDHATALVVIKILQNLAKNGCLVICSIHQPSTKLFEVFDDLMLMHAGVMVYSGPREKAVDAFGNASLTIPLYYNPAEFYIKFLAETKPDLVEYNQKISKIQESCGIKIEEINYKKVNKLKMGDRSFMNFLRSKYACNAWYQFWMLYQREFLISIRDPMQIIARVIQATLFSLIIGLLYLNSPYDLGNLINLGAVIFFILVNFTYSSIVSCAFTFPIEISIFRAQHKNKMYRTVSYYTAKVMSEIPVYIGVTLLHTLITHFMIGFHNTAKAFFIHFSIMFFSVEAALSYGYFISSFSKDVAMSVSISALVMLVLLLFGGFFVKDSQVPGYLKPLRYISFLKYGFEGIVIGIFKDRPFVCSNIFCGGKGEIVPGTDAIEFYDVNPNILGIDFVSLVVITIGLRVLGYFCLLLRVYLNER